jgi:hypothetical protein
LAEINTGLGWKVKEDLPSPQKQVKVAILISDKVDFILTLIKQNKGQYIQLSTYMHPMSVHPISSKMC